MNSEKNVERKVYKRLNPFPLALLTVLLLFLFLAVLASQGEFFSWDYWIREEFRSSHFPALKPWMLVLTRLAEGSFLTLFLLGGFGFLWWQRERHRAIFLLIYTIVFSPLPTLLKLLIARPRPKIVVSDYAVSGYGFPSGHAFAALAFYGFLAYLLGKHLQHRSLRWTLFAFCVLAILVVGASRIYFRSHWLSDVVGGYLGGGVYLLAALYLLERYEGKTAIEQNSLGK